MDLCPLGWNWKGDILKLGQVIHATTNKKYQSYVNLVCFQSMNFLYLVPLTEQLF